MVTETLKLLKKTENEKVSEKIFTQKELDELISEKSDRGLAKKILEKGFQFINVFQSEPHEPHNRN